MIRALALLLLALAASASDGMHFGVDRSADWYRLDVSHHDQHLVGGVAIGALSFIGASLVTDSRPARYATAIGAGVVVGYGYELATGRDGSSYVDHVDAGWVVVGAIAGAALTDLIGQEIIITPHHDGGAVALALRF